MTNESNYWTRRRVSRRGLLRGAAIGGAGLAGAVLIGCGGDDDDEATPVATTAPAGTATAAPTQAPGAAATATPTPTPEPTPAGPTSGGSYTTIRTGDPPSLDPYANLSYLTKGWATYMYSRLYMRYSKPGIPGAASLPGPDLALSAETGDGATWVVKLNPKAKFKGGPPDGRDVSAEDVKFSWDRLKAPESAAAPLVKHMTGLEVIDDSTLRFTHENVNAVFLDNLADANLLWVMPTESDGGFDPETWAYGSGPWTVKKFTPDVTMEFTRNPDWHFGPERPYLDELRQPVIPEYSNQLAQLQAGNIDYLGIVSDDVLGLKGESKYAHWNWITGDPGSTLNAMMVSDINDSSKPWSDERVRQAMSMSLDRAAKLDFEYNVNAFRKAGLNPSESWHNVIPVGQARWWLDPQSPEQGASAKFFQYDPAEAKKLMAAAGFADGFDAKFIYNTNRYGGRFGDVQEVNLAYLQEIGINPQVEIQDYSSIYITESFRGKFEGILSMWETPFPEAGSYPMRLFNPDDELNHSRVKDDVLWDLAVRQGQEVDFESRREMLFEIQRRNAERMYYIPMTYGGGTGFGAAQPWIKNIGIYRTQGYGWSVEIGTYFWVDQEEKAKYS